MANITRIKAGSGHKNDPKNGSKTPPKAETSPEAKKAPKDASSAKQELKTAKNEQKAAKKAEKAAKKKPAGKIKRFFTAPFRYIHNSWLELRQVRWPSRSATWKMVLAVLAYTALIMVIIALLDVFFTWLFNLILSK